MKINLFFIAIACYISLVYLLWFTGLSHPVLIGIIIGWLVVDRVIIQGINRILVTSLVNTVVRAKAQGVDLTEREDN